MKALNRAFEKAFANSEADNNLTELLSCMGEELGCDRISIFEETEEGNVDNTYEWCGQGIAREQILLQHLAVSSFDTWKDTLIEKETIIVRSPEELKEHDPDVYQFFITQQIQTAMVTLLAFHGKNFGFCILENPDCQVMEDQDLIMPGIRYILSSMIYSRNLVDKLRRFGYIDTLTGAGNRVSLQEHLAMIDHKKPVCVISLDVLGWDNAEGKLPHLEKEQTLLRAGEILTNLFDEEHVFRIATGEFVIIENGTAKEMYETNLFVLRRLFRENNLLAAISGKWMPQLDGTMDMFIHAVHQTTEEEKATLLEHRRSITPSHTDEAENYEKADIDLPKGDAFFRLGEQFLSEVFEEAVVTIVTDINYFNLYNDIFGRKAGNLYLQNMSQMMEMIAQEHHGICGYIGGDNFCLVLPTQTKSIEEATPRLEELYGRIDYPDGFAPAMGVYFSEDRRQTMITLYDRALTALNDIKGDYIKHINFYNAETHKHQREDKLLLMNVREGLSQGEFIFYIQPQVNEKTEKIIGGEALVRWLHGGKLISPGEFIPILEKTGYIYAVDAYVWDSVAAWIRSLIDRGIQPVPISVNVSKVDFYFDDIAEHFINLIKKYDLDPELIGVEITESAFTDNLDTIMDSVGRLHEAGFRILMDDFGSGSSSLSMLHAMNLDVLKTDVRFMSKDSQDNRAISIVESVISMAHMIGMSVVTEGVETEEQKENLIALGENYAQGFYFYKPMPKENFEELILDRANVSEGYHQASLQIASHLSFREMIREGLVSETLLENIIRASAIFRDEAGELSIVQLNDYYSELTGITQRADDPDLTSALRASQAVGALKALMQQADTRPLGGSEGIVEFNRPDGTRISLNVRIFLLYSFDNHRLYLSTAE